MISTIRAAVLFGGIFWARVSSGETVGGPLLAAPLDSLAKFQAGRLAFEEVETPEDGLGPLFNGRSCAECHSAGATGGGSTRIETRFGMAGEVFDPLPSHGGSLIQTDGIGQYGTCETTYVGETVPEIATVVAGRRSTPLFGLGLIEAVPDSTLEALAARQARIADRRPGSPRGRPARIIDVATGESRIGRFGWKNQIATILTFSGDAYLNEMGITTPIFPDESCPQGDCSLLACDPIPGIDDDMEDLILFTDFMTFLAPVAPASSHRAGSRVFNRIGCNDCHTRTLATGPNANPALNQVTFRPFSDFLLHDMGSLGDGVAQGDAGPTEMRTAPLWGLRFVSSFLHDGRARSIEEAILGHAGEGELARDRFISLKSRDRTALLRFLGSL
jgi:CxxC motif-containing protein (DUF1111 family)